MILSELDTLQEEWGNWSDTTFGAHRNPAAPIAHLAKEVVELRQSPFNIEEYADCLALLLDAARHAGFSGHELIKASYLKLEINKTRKWGKPDTDGVVEHIR